MKFNKGLIIENLFFIILFVIFGYLLITIPTMSEEVTENKNYSTICTFFIIVESLLFLAITVTIFTGEFFYKIIYIDSDKFQIIEFENLTIMSYDNWAWLYRDKKKVISKLESIKTIHYYTIRKKYRNWKPLPFQS